MVRLRAFLSPPVFPADEERTRLAALAHSLVLVSLAGVGLHAVGVLLVTPSELGRLVPHVPALALLGYGEHLIRSGRVRPAAHLLTAGLWLVLMLRVVTYGGVRNPSFGGAIVVVIGAGLIFGRGPALAFALGTAAMGLATVLGEKTGLLLPPEQYSPSSMAIWLGHTVYFLVAVALLVLVSHTTTEALRHAQVEMDERRRAEEELLQAQKLESIGRLAGGVAHDLNNLLTVIVGSVELASRRAPPDHAIARHLNQIREASNRAAGLTSQLLAFARRQVIAPQIVSLKDVLEQARGLLHRLIGEDVELSLAVEPDLWPVFLDPNQFHQLLMNLAVNARDAMPRGGHLTFAARNVPAETAAQLGRASVEPRDYVAVTMADSGEGIPAEVLPHVFEPFFTTKAAGKGTGLGLAVSHGIVEQNQGHIWVESVVGRGTTFTVLLPRAAGEAHARLVPQPVTLPRGADTILLVEDEPMVRALAVEALREQGYTVLDAGDGEAALAEAERHAGEIDLLLTDVVMPRMSGKALAERLAAVRPSVRVLFTSGHPRDVIADHGVLDASVRFLQKPYTAESLARRVREVLDARAG